MSVPRTSARPTGYPARPLGLHDAWWTVAAASLMACAGLAACTWIAVHVEADPALHTTALFVHLASLVLGFGAVLVVDYYGVLWITRRCALRETLGATSRLHTPIWAGLAGLIVSGMMLHPDLASPITRIKLVLVVVLTVNGLQAGLLDKRMAEHPAAEPVATRLLAWGAGTALVSQICWWGAVVIGFRNSQG